MWNSLSRRRALAALAAPLVCRPAAAAEVVRFSGRDWEVKTSEGRVGPGPNYFSANNVEVDQRGRLHLRVAPRDGGWTCAEVIGVDSLGYGTYEFKVEDVAGLDANVVLGMFTWDTDARQYHFREIDIEISRWSDPNNRNAQFVVQPYTRPENIVRFDLPAGASTHSFRWFPGRVLCRSARGSLVVCRHGFTSGVPPAGVEHPHINLWLFGGRPPGAGGLEVVVSRFSFQAGPHR
jgi:hypothetical protein